MSDETDAIVRVGLALYRHSEFSSGTGFVAVQSLVYEQIAREAPRGIFDRLFGTKEFDFWGQQENLAKKLSATGLAEMHSQAVDGDRHKRDYFLKLTPLGKSFFSIASNANKRPNEFGSISFEDLDLALRNSHTASALAEDLRKGAEQVSFLPLHNSEKAAAQTYISMMTMIAEMPKPDTGLFWQVLERLNQFAGVASLIVAIIALRLAK